MARARPPLVLAIIGMALSRATVGGGRTILTVVALFIAVPPAEAYDDRLDETVAHRQRLKDYDGARRYGAERVWDRVRTPFQPDGIRAGDFMIFPSLGIATVYDDNIYASAGPRIPDIRFELKPQIRLTSQLPRHAVDLSLGGRIVEYLENKDMNHADAYVRAAGALHFDHAHTISAAVLSELVHPDLLDISSPIGARKPVELLHNRASIGLTRDAGRLYGTISAGFESWDYKDIQLTSGEVLSQDVRDGRLFDTQIRVGYRMSPGFELLGRLRGLRYVADIDGPRSGTGNGFEAFAGLAFQSSPLLRWRLLGGYGLRDYDAPGVASLKTSLLEGEVEWLPTQLMTISATVRRQISEAGGNAVGEGTGRIETSILAKLQYEVWRNLVLTVSGELRDLDFVGVERHDRIASGRVGLDYLMTKNLHLNLSWEHQHRTSTDAAFDLNRNIVRFGATARF